MKVYIRTITHSGQTHVMHEGIMTVTHSGQKLLNIKVVWCEDLYQYDGGSECRSIKPRDQDLTITPTVTITLTLCKKRIFN